MIDDYTKLYITRPDDMTMIDDDTKLDITRPIELLSSQHTLCFIM